MTPSRRGITASYAGLAVALAAALLAARLLPPPGGSAASGLAGLPRLVAYAIAGLALALTTARCVPRLPPAWRATLRTDLILAASVLLSIGLTIVNVRRLQVAIVDPSGPPLWIAAMLALLLGALAASGPFARPRLARPHWALLLLVGLLAYGTLIRFVALDTVPLGINPDEGDRASTALDVLDGTAPPSLFDSGWFFINMVYFRLLALCMSIFGPDITGGRTGSAIVGSLFLVGLAWVACRHFGWRVGLVAVALATATGIALQHGRLIAETGPTALLWVISVGGFLEGARKGRPWAFAVAGLSGGLGLYFYPSARLWAVGAVATVALIWLQTYRGRIGTLVRGTSVAALGALVAAAPFLVHLEDHPIEITGRYAQTAVLDPANQVRLAYLTPPEPIVRLFLLQAERTLGMFDRYPDGGGFLPTGAPMFPLPLGMLALVALAFALVRAVRDPRLAILVVWVGIGLSGVLVTVETPDMIRSVGMLPALFIVLAVALVEVVDRVLDAAQAVRPSGARVLFAWAVPLAIAALVVGTDSVAYFRTFATTPSGWGPMTREGQAVATLGQTGPVYSMETNEHMVTSGWVRMLAPRAQRGRIPNPGRELPVLAPTSAAAVRPEMAPQAGQAMNFLLSPDPNQLVYVDLLYRLYPGGWLDDALDGRRSYSVDPSALAQTQGVLAHAADGRAWRVDRFGALPATVAASDVTNWSAGVLLPRSGDYQFQVIGPGRLQLDGVPVGERVLAARGVHFVQLSVDARASADLHLLLDGVEPGPRETYALMDAPWGLLGRVAEPAGGDAVQRDPGFLDATIAMAFFDPELGGQPLPNTLTWSGTVLAPGSGAYRMAFAAEDPMQLEVDGQPMDVVTLPPERWTSVGAGSLVQLSQGAHTVRITLQVTHGGRELARWNWVPPLPNGQPAAQADWTVVPPMVLRPDQPIQPLP